jgi:cytidyltransferase-like protein
MVYGDILNGVPIVDIVRAEDAQEVIYNTVHAYAAKVLQERLEPVLEIIEDEIEDTIEIEDEDDDPVGPAPEDRTVAIVPGAFKPPHLGHADMVRKYAAMADEVIVLISKPLQSVRSLPNGRVITAEDSLKIWELLTKDIPNVTIGVYNDPAVRSPMSAGYALVGKPGEREVAATKVEPPIEAIAPGNKVILGASRKGGDWKRWQGAEKYVGEDLDLLDPALTAVKPLVRSEDAAFSATDMRELLGDPLNNTQELEEYIGPGNVPELLSILGLSEEPLEEMSGMAGGAVGGFSAPFGRSSAVKRRFKKKKRRKKRKKKRNESIDLTIVDEIFKLLIERGVIT